MSVLPNTINIWADKSALTENCPALNMSRTIFYVMRHLRRRSAERLNNYGKNIKLQFKEKILNLMPSVFLASPYLY